MITSLPTSVFQRHHSEKHLSEFYPQDGGESQLALKLRSCHPVYTHMLSRRGRLYICLFVTLVYRKETTGPVVKQLTVQLETLQDNDITY